MDLVRNIGCDFVLSILIEEVEWVMARIGGVVLLPTFSRMFGVKEDLWGTVRAEGLDIWIGSDAVNKGDG